jgi:hypothetical protein
MTDTFEGGCACGAIRYKCRAELVASFNGHCRACQRFTGSTYVSGVLVSAAAFELTQGEPTYYTSKGDSGHDLHRGICARCSSPVVARFDSMPEVVGVPAASLDVSSWHKPEIDIYTASAQAWDYVDPELPKFPQGLIARK